MSTRAHSTTWYIARNWETYYASAVLAGIVGDLRHMLQGGYHVSIQDNPAFNFSVIRIDDKAPPGDWPRDLAAAIDMSMSPSDMALCSGRLWNVWNDTSDPRRVYLNAFNGWENQANVPAKRYDYVTQKISVTTSDHKSHVHKEIKRRWVTSMIAANAILSILRGETKAQYLSGTAERSGEMQAKRGDGMGSGVPAHEDTTYLQEKMLYLRPEATNDAHPLVVDGEYGPNTAWWVSIILTGGDGNLVTDNWFHRLDGMVNAKVTDEKIAAAIVPPAPVVSPEAIKAALLEILPSLTITVRP